ncbi:phospholipase domain-containing protein [Streptomyces sp. NPDC059352]|uniref:phospholipase domain-containing protein n=1 Tax=Streptomyces sp. NPDC059352 TaxID=3346810 RepID=UPI0036BD6DB2
MNLINAYGGAQKTLSVAKGATVTNSVDASAAHHWYDVTVTSSASTDYVRRLAGHVETGAASQSDPAILTY